MKFTNKHNLPDEIVAMAMAGAHNKSLKHIGVTDLIGPPRLRELYRRNYDELVQDVSDSLAAEAGTAWHAHVEKYVDKDKGRVAELPVSKVIETPEGSVEVRGVLDIRDYPGRIVADWKTCKVFAFLLGAKQDWIAQVNVYAYLDDKEPKAERLEIRAKLTDWSSYEALRNPDYPRCEIHTVQVPMWPAERTEAYVRERVALHLKAQKLADHDLPPCTSEERWERPTKYGVRKDKAAKQALPGTSTESRQIAEQSLRKARAKYPKAYIHEVRGEAVRCERFCLVAPFCNQRKAELAANAA